MWSLCGIITLRIDQSHGYIHGWMEVHSQHHVDVFIWILMIDDADGEGERGLGLGGYLIGGDR